ncbi:10446_t:CDS:10 [Funneliformis geosporum]|uniref:8102_t:CDS:1 n=1 Tax=Funneliformis geosporum TaxID=1117311 RepID=A0A9W4SYD6_9GLOM|nr:10446_t:CDS:10 [Funneliformis geosporum]CAI2188119.1 8102_t:CDS:10 [Funneliformis geosporum]
MITLKDILRNISIIVNSSNANVQPIIDSIEKFITAQESTAEQHKADKIEKISSELHQLYNAIEDFPNKFCSFLKCLRALLPILGPDIIISDWWDNVLVNVLQSPLQPKDIVEQVKGLVQDVLVCETDKVLEFRKEILVLYLKESCSVGKAAGGEEGIVGEQVHAFWCRNLDSVLRGFGAVKTKEFFILLNSYFIQRLYRLQVLTLFGEFIRKQNSHIHQILETPLLNSLLTSLQQDTSTTLLSLSLTSLIMLLPHICTSVITYLPRLYIVFVRIICWDKHNARLIDFEDEIIGNDYDEQTSEAVNAVNWEQCDSSFDNVSSSPPNCMHLFTFLYGMFPCNTVKFLRSPTAWIKEMEQVTAVDDIDDEIIRARSLPLLRRHKLHPSLITSDAEKELSDTSRWMKLEPADIVAEYVSYDMENATKKYDSNELEGFTKVLKEADTTMSEMRNKKARPLSQAISMKEIMEVHKALKSGADIVVGDDPWASKIISYSNSLSSSHPISPPENNAPPLKPTTNIQASVAFLQREIMLLRNELNFEFYLKQQHLQHIGRLHRDHVLDSTVEAERQNLYNTCRTLRSQLSNTQAAFDRQRTETAHIKKRHVQWEDELNGKLKKYREEKKEWKGVLDKVEQELREAKLIIDVQNKQIKEISAKEADTRKFQEQKRLMESLVGKWHKMEVILKAGEHEIKQLKSVVSSQSFTIDDLQIKLENHKNISGGPGNAMEKQMMIWSFERDKRDKEFIKLETRFDQVKKQNGELQSRVIDLLAQVESLSPTTVVKKEVITEEVDHNIIKKNDDDEKEITKEIEEIIIKKNDDEDEKEITKEIEEIIIKMNDSDDKEITKEIEQSIIKKNNDDVKEITKEIVKNANEKAATENDIS